MKRLSSVIVFAVVLCAIAYTRPTASREKASTPHAQDLLQQSTPSLSSDRYQKNDTSGISGEISRLFFMSTG